MFIAKFASEVTIIVLHDEGVLDCNKVAAEKAFAHPKLKFVWNSSPAAILGEDEVTGLQVKNSKTGELTDIPCEGVFFFVGQVPETKGLTETGLAFNGRGYTQPTTAWKPTSKAFTQSATCATNTCARLLPPLLMAPSQPTAAERYIEELKDFNTRVLGSDQASAPRILEPGICRQPRSHPGSRSEKR